MKPFEVDVAGLFEGFGGLTMAVRAVLGGEFGWYSEIEPAACRVLEHHHPGVPNLGDVTTVEWAEAPRPRRLTMGFPCQDVSSAGRRAGMRPDSRSGLWTHGARAINVLRPELVVIENVRGLLSADADAPSDVEPCPWCLGEHPDRPLRALGAVLGDLAVLGYDAQWCGLRASDLPVGACHPRFRVFILAWPAGNPPSLRRDTAPVARPGGDLEPAGATRGPSRIVANSTSAERAAAQPDHLPAGRGSASEPGERPGEIAWGDVELAVRRWERTLGRVAPPPAQDDHLHRRVVSPHFVEWMMGLPDGYVTAVPELTHGQMLERLGNGVVWQQAAEAIRYLLEQIKAMTP